MKHGFGSHEVLSTTQREELVSLFYNVQHSPLRIMVRMHRSSPDYYILAEQYVCLNAGCWRSLFPSNTATLRNRHLLSPAIFVHWECFHFPIQSSNLTVDIINTNVFNISTV
jgi:hypothetical protein